MMQWPTMASGPSRPVSARYSMGVWQWRRRISWNSRRFWPAWISMPTPSSSAAARVARSRAGLHVSTWKGKSIPWMRPPCAPRVPADEGLRAVEGTQPGLLVQLVGQLPVRRRRGSRRTCRPGSGRRACPARRRWPACSSAATPMSTTVVQPLRSISTSAKRPPIHGSWRGGQVPHAGRGARCS